MRVKLTLEYNGAAFSGWQSQPGLRTIQGCLDEALETYFHQRFDTTASGRTDKGVHAKAQVVSFELAEAGELDLSKVKNSLNGITPDDIRVKSVDLAADDFNARLNAHVKCYAYSLNVSGQRSPLRDDYVYTVKPNLNFAEIIKAAKFIEGEQDFSSFRCTDCTAKTTIRTIVRSEFVRIDQDTFQYRVHGKGFLMHMIRIVTGTLLAVGKGKISAEDLPRIIEAKDRTQAGDTLPAKGLSLEWVRYL